MINEAIFTTEAQLVQVWRDDAIVLCIGDHFQLCVVSMSKSSSKSIRVSQLTHPPYVRFGVQSFA